MYVSHAFVKAQIGHHIATCMPPNVKRRREIIATSGPADTELNLDFKS
jgi:hypothetical protein